MTSTTRAINQSSVICKPFFRKFIISVYWHEGQADTDEYETFSSLAFIRISCIFFSGPIYFILFIFIFVSFLP
jgi:hypothetical protein